MRGINLPQTFERRGTTVPFHQKDLGHTRVREYFHGQERILEAAIPNFSGGRRGELVVVPWEQLPGIATLDQRDQRVHERIMANRTTRDLDPIKLRALCLDRKSVAWGKSASVREEIAGVRIMIK